MHNGPWKPRGSIRELRSPQAMKTAQNTPRPSQNLLQTLPKPSQNPPKTLPKAIRNRYFRRTRFWNAYLPPMFTPEGAQNLPKPLPKPPNMESKSIKNRCRKITRFLILFWMGLELFWTSFSMFLFVFFSSQVKNAKS